MSNDKTPLVEHHVAHHFDTAEQEFETAKLGMWVFLAQEILFFSAIFVTYIVFRMLYPGMFIEASQHLSWKLGALNTVFLITSSFTMVMGVRSAQVNERVASIKFLISTFLLAGAFMVVKFVEYSAKFHHGLLPGKFFFAEGSHETLHIFFGLYFAATGLHGLHVLVGMGLIAWLIIRSLRGEFHSDYYTPVEMVGLYWHLVDLIWIFLFPLLYLVG